MSILKSWWHARGVDLDELTATDHGFLISDNNIPIASVFLYPVIDCKMAMIGFPVSNPDIDKDLRREALTELIGCVEARAYHMNYDYLIGYPGNEASMKLFERHNYKVLDENVKQFGKRL